MAIAKTAAASLAIDPRGVESLRRQKGDQAAAGVAKQFEAMLMQQMLASMRQATPRFSEGSDSSALDMFRGMYDQQLSQTWAQQGSLGLSDVILRQIQVQQNPALLKQVQTGSGQLQLQRSLDAVRAGFAAAPAKTADQPASGRLDGSAEGFISKVKAAAGLAAKALNVAPAMLIGHAALESGWGKKSIKDEQGNETWNLFGIKAGKSWTGKTVDVLTTEYVDGQPQKRVEKFRAYASLEDAFADYTSLLQRRYGEVMGTGSDAGRFGQALARGGYATAPDYAHKVARVVQSVQQRINGSSNAG
ncbi:flagellar assembly peptidoglycan hydrolase FlgJ [Chitinilyticum aquatile]|uniref:flagellar assembly peptidoglycan hydrolase FlgJ n=1 Tax=Chitinilyticum aquatile TaxID=362520 RepID=UPI0003F57DF3|nr:flagellar assembly peptidoglycan hydrolase FlgJ [Chitinilyticum aquatile]